MIWPIIVVQLRQAPVEHQRFAELAEHHVERFEVAMKNSLFVSKRDRLTDGDELPQQPSERQLPLASAAWQRVQSIDRHLHSASLDELHGVERRAVLLKADVIDGHDPRMLQLSGDLSLVQEPLDNTLGLERQRQEFLERDLAMERGVFRTPDFSQAALRNVVDQPIPILRSGSIALGRNRDRFEARGRSRPLSSTCSFRRSQ